MCVCIVVCRLLTVVVFVFPCLVGCRCVGRVLVVVRCGPTLCGVFLIGALDWRIGSCALAIVLR